MKLKNYLIYIFFIINFSCVVDENKEYIRIVGNENPIMNLDEKLFFNRTFDVYDSLNYNQKIGWEFWEKFTNYKHLNNYNNFKIQRFYNYDSSGGLISFHRHSDGIYKIHEDTLNRDFLFINSRSSRYFPQELTTVDSFSIENPGFSFKIRSRMYSGLKIVPYKNTYIQAFRSGRDSTAIDGTPKPYISKYEDYYFNIDNTLIYMTEEYVRHENNQDIVLSFVSKRNR